MVYKALKSFAGRVTMTRGKTKEIKDEALAKDLLQAGYIEPVKAEAVKSEPKAEPSKRGRKPKANEG